MAHASAEPSSTGNADGTVGSNAARTLRTYLGPHRAVAAVLAVTTLVYTALQVANPQLLGRFIDGVRSGAPLSNLLGLGAIYLSVAVVAQVIWIVAEYRGARVAWSATNELRADLTEHCLRLDMSFYERHAPGELIDRIDGDVSKLANYFSQMFLLVLSNVLLVVGIGVALFVQDWRIGLVYAPFVTASFFLLRRLVGTAVPAMAAQREANAKLLGFFEERLNGLPDLRANGAEEHTVHGFWTYAGTLFWASRRAALLGVRWPAAAQSLASAGFVMALGAGVWLYTSGQITLGAAYTLVVYAVMVQTPMLVITSQFHDLEAALGALRRIHGLLDEHSVVRTGEATLPAGAPAVEFERVSFSYRPEEDALRDISLRLRPKTRLAIVGRTGSGKSTLIRLLFRFADPTQGTVRFDGRDVREISVASLRDQVGLVTQEVQLFAATVRDNVTLFDDTVDDARVREALAEVGLRQWLESLPAGLDTLLGPGDTGLSAGQEQLLAFARVLIQDPGLVLLDEATSRLDPASLRVFETAMERLLAGRTAIIVAHRLETLGTVDEVLLLSDGRVAEHGPRDRLVADPSSRFSRLLAANEALA
ncbi:ABC transporter ATP-binding protein [Actinomadura citrea]|uniref:ABC-type multidrug transport system fused ATPase/permease subunit n=1 Tax=Actinomadura citrea TaxID=46158 RepID=A0A7Y9G7S0_9ACTN|nr:ABC transporter ATP-binding protein [Actinomadura citrea]NYE11477.1 ABC-type multidrug transport system fused ATPase/permease subunit [Actinomadura citrea]GGT88045.1 helicase [Actinomadura citrea]